MIFSNALVLLFNRLKTIAMVRTARAKSVLIKESGMAIIENIIGIAMRI